MKTIALPLLAVAAVLIPSDSPARNAPSLAQASATASASIVPAARIEWSRVMAETASRPGLRPWNGPRLVRWTGPHGEIRNELQFQ